MIFYDTTRNDLIEITMVRHKHEVYEWFQGLDASSRIDVISSMFESFCTSFELRFFGTCLEDLARSDYVALKDSTDRANNFRDLQELTKINTLPLLHQDHKMLRGHIVVSMCLLKSKPLNALCSRVLYDILREMDIQLSLFSEEHLNSTSWQPDETKALLDDVQLLLTLAIHHPAFTFSQRQAFDQQLKMLRTHKIFQRVGSTEVEQRIESKDAQCQTDTVTVQEVG